MLQLDRALICFCHQPCTVYTLHRTDLTKPQNEFEVNILATRIMYQLKTHIVKTGWNCLVIKVMPKMCNNGYLFRLQTLKKSLVLIFSEGEIWDRNPSHPKICGVTECCTLPIIIIFDGFPTFEIPNCSYPKLIIDVRCVIPNTHTLHLRTYTAQWNSIPL